MKGGCLQIIPLGGLGEIGKNIMALRYKNDIIVIDAGLMFPDDEMLGIDLVIPDISYLVENRKHIRGIVLTHGHEDHIGALPYILREVNVPVYGTKLTLGLLEAKLKESSSVDQVQTKCVCAGETIKLGAFKIEFIHVSHSIADVVALGIRTPVGTIIHTGDFKFDQTPINNKPTDYHKLLNLAKRVSWCCYQTAPMLKDRDIHYRSELLPIPLMKPFAMPRSGSLLPVSHLIFTVFNWQ